MSELDDKRDDERRSPVGDFMLGQLGAAKGKPVTHGELMSLAAERRLSVSQVLAWIAAAGQGELVPAVQLTSAGELIVGRDRRSTARRRRPG